MKCAADADLPLDQFGGGSYLQRLELPEVTGAKVKGTGRVTLADPDLANREFFDVEKHCVFRDLATQ